ncbi:MAG: phage holin family protein [Microbacteriaceae bacterium]|nr:phage holin family protein [Microbacteriaceae bacterium]
MTRLLLGLIINTAALWIADSFVEGIHLIPFGSGEANLVLSYAAVAAVFGIVNAVIGNFIRIVAFPLYLLTLGLVALLVNAGLLTLVSQATQYMGFGLVIDDFSWGVIGALVMSLCNWLIGIALRPFMSPVSITR